MVDQGRIVRLPKILDPASFSGATLAVISTGCPGLDAVAADLARSAGALVNVVDRPSLSDVTMPALVDRDPVVIAIGTEGTAPVLGRKIKSHIESYLEPSLGKFATFAGGLRRDVTRRFSGRIGACSGNGRWTNRGGCLPRDGQTQLKICCAKY